MKKLWLIGALFAGAAWAHSPFLTCQHIENNQIQCKGGFSDGSEADGIDLIVYDYNNAVLFQTFLDGDSQATFPAPSVEEYFIFFDGGPGHEIELDYLDISK